MAIRRQGNDRDGTFSYTCTTKLNSGKVVGGNLLPINMNYQMQCPFVSWNLLTLWLWSEGMSQLSDCEAQVDGIACAQDKLGDGRDAYIG